MGRYSGNHIDNPVAYDEAIARRIKANRWKTNSRKMTERLASETPLFAWWLMGYDTPELKVLGDKAFGDDVDANGFSVGDSREYDRTVREMRKRYGWPAEFLGQAIREWGGLTDNQYAYAKRAFAQATEKAEATEAKRAAERANAQPAPTGRLVVEGEVVKTDALSNAYGTRYVMTVKTAAGWLCWGSIPSDIPGVQRGAKVRFTATLEQSDKDATFAFFKRPTKAEILNQEEAA